MNARYFTDRCNAGGVNQSEAVYDSHITTRNGYKVISRHRDPMKARAKANKLNAA